MYFMKQRAFLNDLNLEAGPLNRVSLVLDRIESGSDKVLVSPIGEAISPDKILSDWDKIFYSNLSKINDTLREFEDGNRSKFGPRSLAKPWVDRKSSLTDYFGKDNGKSINYKFQDKRLRALSVENAADYLKNSTSSGLPFMVKKGNIKSSLVNNFKDLLNRKDPCILYTRTQENNKTRNVWGYPASDTLNEMRFYRPLLGYQSRKKWRSALNLPVDVDRSMTNLIRYSQNTKHSLVSLDMSSYDASIKTSLQKSSFNYIQNLFQTNYHGELEYIFDRFNKIGVITPDGILSGPHGVPSGSTFTNEVDSIAQYLVAYSYFGNENFECQIQGDDGAYVVQDKDSFFDHFESYGLTVNKDKSYISNDYLVYLQSLYHKDYFKDGIIGGIYSTYRALLRIVYLERFEDFSKDDIEGKDYFAIRTLSILENCKHHPLFKELVEYIIKLDKYSLKVSDQGLLNYVKMRRRQDGKDIRFGSWTYGDDISGLKSFKSYQIVKSYVE